MEIKQHNIEEVLLQMFCIHLLCPDVLGQNPRSAMGCRLAVLSHPGHLVMGVGYTCIADHQHHTRDKGGSLMR